MSIGGKVVVKISPVSEAKKRADRKWHDANYTQVNIAMPNSEAARLNDYCKKKNISKAGFVRQAITEKIERNS